MKITPLNYYRNQINHKCNSDVTATPVVEENSLPVQKIQSIYDKGFPLNAISFGMGIFGMWDDSATSTPRYDPKATQELKDLCEKDWIGFEFPLKAHNLICYKKADPNVQNDNGDSVLHIIVSSHYNCDKQIIKDIVKAGADINQQGYFGLTPICGAAASSYKRELCKILYQLGAKPEIRNDGNADAFERARKYGKFDLQGAIDEAEKELKQEKAAEAQKAEQTITQETQPQYNSKATKELKELCEKHIMDDDFLTKAHDLICNKKANPNVQTTNNDNILHWIAVSNTKYDEKMIEDIVNAGAYINMKSSVGYTPIILAAFYGKKELCKIYYQLGANPEIEYNYLHDYKADAFDVAKKYGKFDLQEIINEAEKEAARQEEEARVKAENELKQEKAAEAEAARHAEEKVAQKNNALLQQLNPQDTKEYLSKPENYLKILDSNLSDELKQKILNEATEPFSAPLYDLMMRHITPDKNDENYNKLIEKLSQLAQKAAEEFVKANAASVAANAGTQITMFDKRATAQLKELCRVDFKSKNFPKKAHDLICNEHADPKRRGNSNSNVLVLIAEYHPDCPANIISDIAKHLDINDNNEFKRRTAIFTAASHGYIDLCRILYYLGADPTIKNFDKDDAFDAAKFDGNFDFQTKVIDFVKVKKAQEAKVQAQAKANAEQAALKNVKPTEVLHVLNLKALGIKDTPEFLSKPENYLKILDSNLPDEFKQKILNEATEPFSAPLYDLMIRHITPDKNDENYNKLIEKLSQLAQTNAVLSDAKKASQTTLTQKIYNEQATFELHQLCKYNYNASDFPQKAHDLICNEKANPDTKVSRDWSALHFIMRYHPDCSKKIIEDIVEAGADINAKTSSGLTAILLAAQRGHIDFCRWLYELGANPAIEDCNGNNAFSAALDKFDLQKVIDEVEKEKAEEAANAKVKAQKAFTATEVLNSLELKALKIAKNISDNVSLQLITDLSFYSELLQNQNISKEFKEKLFNSDGKFFEISLLVHFLSEIDNAEYQDPNYRTIIDELKKLNINFDQTDSQTGHIFENIIQNQNEQALDLLISKNAKLKYDPNFDEAYSELPANSEFKKKLDTVKFVLVDFPDIDKYRFKEEELTARSNQLLSPFFNSEKYKNYELKKACDVAVLKSLNIFKKEDNFFSDINEYHTLLTNDKISDKFKEELFNEEFANSGCSLLIHLLFDVNSCEFKNPKYSEIVNRLKNLTLNFKQSESMTDEPAFKKIIQEENGEMLDLFLSQNQLLEYNPQFDKAYENLPENSCFKRQLDKVIENIVTFPFIEKALESRNSKAITEILPSAQSPFFNIFMLRNLNKIDKATMDMFLAQLDLRYRRMMGPRK